MTWYKLDLTVSESFLPHSNPTFYLALSLTEILSNNLGLKLTQLKTTTVHSQSFAIVVPWYRTGFWKLLGWRLLSWVFRKWNKTVAFKRHLMIRRLAFTILLYFNFFLLFWYPCCC